MSLEHYNAELASIDMEIARLAQLCGIQMLQPGVAEAIVETLQSARQNVLIQKFVAESNGCDLRALVVGGKVVAAMRRVAAKGEYRSNVHRGGSAEPVMHPRNLGIDFPLDRLTLIERGFRPSAEILLLQLPHESYFVEELPRVHFSAIL